jgi:hypothetical protein
VLLRLSLLLVLLLSSCGDLPEPFLGNPGAEGRLLAQPPTPRLVVSPPANALLTDQESHSYATALATSLQALEVPAFAENAQRSDWRLIATAETRGNTVVPVFQVLNPQGKDKGKVEGSPVPAQDWANATGATLTHAASDAAPKISGLLTSIQHADPTSLYNRIAKVDVPDVTGAPGDGNVSLTKQIRAHLAALGPLVQDTPAGADFIVQGSVKIVPITGNQQRVEIQWAVSKPSGDERGKVVQLNDIPAGSLDHYWADVAVVVATEAAGGVNDVINRQSGREPGQAPAAGQAANGHAGAPLVEGRKAGVEPVQ